MRSDELHPGDLIAGKYRVRAILGRRHGLLVEAFHTEFDQRVAIKILLAGHGDEREIERFRREARILAKLESEHVARILDLGSEQGSFYLVRQLLDGEDLGTYVRTRGALTLHEAVLFVLQAAEAVAETHAHGIVLRELSPSNLFVTQRPGGAPLVKIIDFGTAKLMRDAAAPGGTLTQTAMFGLSPYSSPELVRKAKDVDQRTDVWSLGAVLYELLAGLPPFHGETAMLMLHITKDEPPPVSSLRPDVPFAIDEVIGWALAKDVDARFSSVHALAHALAPYAPPEGQVLVDRIAQITEAGKQRRRVAPAPPSSSPGRVSEPPPSGGMYVGRGLGSVPPPPPSQPPPAYYGAPASVPPSSMPLPSSSLPYAATIPHGPPSSSHPPAHASVPPEPAPTWSSMPPRGSHAPPPPAAAGLSDRKVALAAGLTIATLVLAGVLALVLLSHRSEPDTTAANESGSAVPIAAPAVSDAPAVATIATADPTTVATAEPAAVPTASASAEVAAIDLSSLPSVSDDDAGAPSAPKPTGSRTHVAAHPKPAPPPPPPPPASSGGAKGSLVAVAVGGNCAFAVNGASKGTSSTLKVSLQPGSYTVTCRAPGGATKSKSVTVRSGETAMAMFKL